MKCDVVIPVYNSPEWVKLCVYSVIKNTNDNLLNKVYLVNDCSDELTTNLLLNLEKKYEKVEILSNKENLGFVKTANKGLKKATSDYVLLLNTDCIISKNTISKLIKHIEKDPKIGLICPIASNAANISLPMYEGYTYIQMDRLLEENFKGECFDACTVVGNCLMISKKCLEKVGYLDEIYGMGYGEETDYQFQAMKKGFKAKVAIDTYVFHKAEVSFGTSKEKKERLEKNRKIFFDRWGKEYYELAAKYKLNDPIEYITSKIKDKKPNFNFVIYLIGIVQNAGGVHNTVDMINYLTINGVDCNIVYQVMKDYKEIMLFNPIQSETLDNYKINKIVSTIYFSTFITRQIATKKKIPLIYFSQGYEVLFENGVNYGVAELSYKLADSVLSISKFLQDEIKNNFKIDSTKIKNGINYDLIHKKNDNNKPKKFTFILRNNPLKGDFIALDIIKNIINKYENIELNVLFSNSDLVLPLCDNKKIKINKIYGNFSRNEIAKILQSTDVYFDTSLTEGFGLIALESMAAGAIPIVSNSGGINEYLTDEKNGFVVNEINDSKKYIEKLELIMNDSKKYNSMKKECEKTATQFDIDNIIEKYINYFNQEFKIKDIKLTEEEQAIYLDVLENKFKLPVKNKPKSFIYKLLRKVPKRFRIFVKKAVEKLYKFTNER